MKLNKTILPALALTLLASSCEDNKMEWGKPGDYNEVTAAEIPLGLAEQIANYKNIKEYIAEYAPHMTLGLGIEADYYMNNEIVKQLADANFQMFTTGNAMKHDAVVKNNGDLNFATIDAFRNAIPADMKLYGHNFLWHTQQNQTYLKSLIAPKMIIQSDSDIANQLAGDNSNFDGGTTGNWGSWGNNKQDMVVAQGEGQDGTDCMLLTNKGDANFWEAQCGYTLDNALQPQKPYIIKFKAKSTSPAGALQFQYQNSTTYESQDGYHNFNVGTEWTDCEYEFTTEYEDVDRIILNFGKVGGSYYIDDIEFGLKKEEKINNIITNSSFTDGTNGWTGLWGKYEYAIEAPGRNDDYAIRFTMSNETSANYDCQLFWTLNAPLEVGKTYAYSFYAKSDMSIAVQAIGQNEKYAGIYKDSFTAPEDWLLCEGEFTYQESDAADIIRFGVQFGGTAGSTVWIDDVKFGEKNEAAATVRTLTRGTTITYELKTPEEKRAALEGAMEAWIKGMFEHIANDNRFVGWDVINEPITDNNYQWRGIDGVFGSNDEDGNPDLAPVEDEANGLTLNWAKGHFYWGHYLGKDYACKAFEFARQYAPEGIKLYVNDYNLETSPGKLNALIEFVNYIDTNNAMGQTLVDGIGTQMHVVSNISKEQVDAMFTTLAATGKLIRITELDVRIGYEATANPSAEQLMAQADTYKMIIESYKANIPEAQQSGITIWGLSDHADEHTYWYPGDTPNIFDANYARKPAYKGVCDGLAGRDISEDFTGEDWKNAYDTDTEETSVK